jgi:hypothetical protein
MMTKTQKRRTAIERMERASARLVEAAHVLCTADNRVCWKIRENTQDLMKHARVYANAVAAVRRS